jgi:putative Holliday junction resolvase
MPDARPVSGYVLSFDFGFRRIGVAVGQTLTGTATPLETVRHGQAPDWPAIERLATEWKPALFVVGLPLAEDGSDSDMSLAARRFGAELAGRFGLPVEYVDERLTSRVAGQRFAEQRAAGAARRKDASRLDAVAAQLICENWLREQRG